MGQYEILRMVTYYEIPLRVARRLAKYSDWEERASYWHRHEPSSLKAEKKGKHRRFATPAEKSLRQITKGDASLTLQQILGMVQFGEEE